MELEFVKFVRSFGNSFLDQFFIFITMLGEPYVLVPFICMIYWSFDKRLGKIMIYSTLLSIVSNGCLKNLFVRARPSSFPEVTAIRPEGGYSFPSGHTQTISATLMPMLFYSKYSKIGESGRFPKKFRIITGVIIFLVGFSRIYIGVHYPTDVLAGFIVGSVIAFVGCRFFAEAHSNNNSLLTSILTLSAMFLLLPLMPDKTSETMLPLFAGFTLGDFLEARFVRFETNGIPLIMRFFRILIGGICTGICTGIVLIIFRFMPIPIPFDTILICFMSTISITFFSPMAFKFTERKYINRFSA